MAKLSRILLAFLVSLAMWAAATHQAIAGPPTIGKYVAVAAPPAKKKAIVQQSTVTFNPVTGKVERVPILTTARQLLNTAKSSVTRVQSKPLLWRSHEMGKGARARLYGVFVEEEQRRGAVWYVGDANWHGKLNFTYNGYGLIGKYYGFSNAAVTRRAAGSGGIPGSVGGWALSSSVNNEQNFGGFSSISNVAGESAKFVSPTGCDALGVVGAYYRSDAGGYAMVAVDDDYTIPTGRVGPLVFTVTAGDILFGRFPSTFVDHTGTTRATLGCRYLDFRRSTLFYEDIGVWEDTSYGNTVHSLTLTVLGANSQKDTSGYRVSFSAFFASSSSQGTVLSQLGTNGQSSYPQSTAASGPYVLTWNEIAGTRVVSNQNTKPVVGGGGFVEDSVYEMSNSPTGTYYFNRITHSDGSSTGTLEFSHVPSYICAVSGTNNAGQNILNVRSGDGLGLDTTRPIYIESVQPTVRTISSIATDALNLGQNITRALNLNTASEKVIQCETTVSGTVTGSTAITLASSDHQIGTGDVCVAVSDATLPVTFTAAAVSGTSLTADRAVSIANGCAIFRISQRGYDNYFLADNRIPVYLKPGGWWTCTDKLELRRTSTSSFAGEGTTLSVAASRGATSITVNSDASLYVGELVTIDAQGAQVRRVTGKPGSNVVNLDKPLDSYAHSGARVARGMFWRQDVCSWDSSGPWQLKVQWIESEYHEGDALKNAYDVMHTGGYAAPRIPSPAVTVTGATNASPIVLTVANHPFQTGQRIRVASVGGNTGANGDWVVTYVDSSHVSLDGSAGTGTYTSGGTATEVFLTYIPPFNSVVALPLRAAPVVDENYAIPKTYNSATSTTTNVSNADTAAFYSTSHDLVYAVRMDDADQLAGTLWGTAQTVLQNRATGDYKIYFAVASSDGGSLERTLHYTTIRKGSYRKQIRRIPGFAAAARRFVDAP